MRKGFWLALALALLVPSLAAAQTTVVTDTARVTWTASFSHNAVFGGQPVLTSYKVELFLLSQVSGGVPSGTAVVTQDVGKPTPNAQNIVLGPVVKPLIVTNTEYVAFVTAVGPGGSSARSLPSDPFGLPAPPSAPAGKPALQ